MIVLGRVTFLGTLCFSPRLSGKVRSQKVEDEDGDFGSELADPEVNSTMDADEVRVVVMFFVLSFCRFWLCF